MTIRTKPSTDAFREGFDRINWKDDEGGLPVPEEFAQAILDANPGDRIEGRPVDLSKPGYPCAIPGCKAETSYFDPPFAFYCAEHFWKAIRKPGTGE